MSSRPGHQDASAAPLSRGSRRLPSRRELGLALAPLAFAAVWLAPLGLEGPAHRLAALFAAIVVLWVTEALPIAATALMIGPGLVILDITDKVSAFAPYADPLLFLFVGGFFIARAMTRHGLDRRIAEGIIRSRWVRGRPLRVRLALLGTGLLLSMWISNTATTAILVPILLGAYVGQREDGVAPADEELAPGARAGLLAVAYACSIGGLGTLVGSPPNLIAARFLSERVEGGFGFLDWMKVGLPTAILIVGAIYLVSLRGGAPGAAVVAAGSRARARTPWSKGEKVTALAFALAVLGWMVPPLLKAAGFTLGATLARLLPGGVVAVAAASVLFLFHDDEGRTVLPWRDLDRPDAAGIDWGIIMLFGGGIALGKQMLDTGLAAEISQSVLGATCIETLWPLVILVTVFTIFFTEIASNTAAANMLVPLVLEMASELQVPVAPPTLAVGLAASAAFMLPIATGPNAIVFGTGQIPLPMMMRTGLVLNFVSAVIIVGVLALLSPLLGWS